MNLTKQFSFCGIYSSLEEAFDFCWSSFADEHNTLPKSTKRNIILGDPGADKGARESLNGWKNICETKKSKERREEPLGTMSYQTSSKRSPPFWLLIGAKKHKFSGTNQKPERRRPFGTGLVRHCPQGLFSPFFTFLRFTFSRPFRLSLAPTICPWVSKDGET